MKLKSIFTLARSRRALLIAATVLLGGASLMAAPGTNFFDNTVSGVNLGNASGGSTGTHSSWAIFALSGGVTITDASLDPTPGAYDVFGNVGTAGAGNVTLTDSWIMGSIYQGSGSTTLAGGAFYTGGYTPGYNAYLNQGVSDANSASSTAAGLAATGGTVTSIALNGTSWTNTNLGLPAAGVANTTYVANLANLVLSNSILTLNGTSTTNFVFNVANYMTLANNSKILLSGGLTQANVLFNVKNTATYDVTLGTGSQVNGIILAPNRNVKENGASVVYGEVIAKSVSLSAGSKVINPLVSP